MVAHPKERRKMKGIERKSRKKRIKGEKKIFLARGRCIYFRKMAQRRNIYMRSFIRSLLCRWIGQRLCRWIVPGGLSKIEKKLYLNKLR